MNIVFYMKKTLLRKELIGNITYIHRLYAREVKEMFPVE